MANEVRLSGLFQAVAGYKDATGNPAKAYEFTPAAVSPRGEAMLRFSIAAPRGEGEDLRITYLRCVAYGTVAEALSDKAGKQVDILGHISVNKVKRGETTTTYTNIVVDAINGGSEAA
jgi:hypothetical protein